MTSETMPQEETPQRPAAPGERLRALLRSGRPTVLPGVFDALSARLASEAGHDALYMSGFAVSASRAALPDTGLLTMTEMVNQATSIVAATGLPILADGDTGYGNAESVARTIRSYEQAGTAGVHIEDMLWPRQATTVISRADMVARIEAAQRARRDESFLIVGRTDAYDTLGIDEALQRVKLLDDVGVDAISVHSLTRREQFLRLRDATELPLVANIVEGLTELESASEFADIGYDIVLFSITALRCVIQETLALYQELARFGSLRTNEHRLTSLNETMSLLSASPA